MSNLFYGRDDELEELLVAWKKASTGESVFVSVKGAPGRGKTKFIQEFYLKLAEEYDQNDYWAKQLVDTGKPYSIVPRLKAQGVENPVLPPWLWLGIRCVSQVANTDAIGVPVAFESARDQMLRHLLVLMLNEEKKNANKRILKSGFGFIASFAIPGGGAWIEFVNQIMDSGSDLLSIDSLSETIKERVSLKRKQNKSNQKGETVHHANIVDQVKQAIGTYIRSTGSPVLIILDDAQFLDHVTVNILKSLLEGPDSKGRKVKEEWPLLIICLSWDDSLENRRSSGFNKNLEELLNKVKEISGDKGNPYKLTYKDIPLDSLEDEYLKKIIDHRLPNIGEEAKKVLAGRSGGNIDMLNDLVEEVESSLGWLNDSGELNVDIKELKGISTEAVAKARRRINAAGNEIKRILTFASSQGNIFNSLLLHRSLDDDVEIISEIVNSSDQDYGFTKTDRKNSGYMVSEFKRYEYFEACRNFFNAYPLSTEYKEKLARNILSIRNEDVWLETESVDQERMLLILMELFAAIDLDEGWEVKQVETLLELGKMRLRSGDYENADNYLSKALNLEGCHENHIIEIRDAYTESAYLQGNIREERRRVIEWYKCEAGTCFEFFIRRAYLNMRLGKCKVGLRSVDLAGQFVKDNGDLAEFLIARSTLQWSEGETINAFNSLVEAEQVIFEEGGKGKISSYHEHSFSHAASLVLHDLEKNGQLLFHAKLSKDLYADEGNVQQELICQVNEGDALWALGFYDEAKCMINNVYEESKKFNLPHVADIASICLSNVLREQGELPESDTFSNEGIFIAEKINHQWDLLYGSIYKQANVLNNDPELASNELSELSKRCLEAGYIYLYDLARAIFIVACERSGTEPSLSFVNVDGKTSNLFKVHLAAYRIISCGRFEENHVEQFLSILASCEGVRGVRSFIFEAINKILKYNNLTVHQKDLLSRWKGLYGSKKVKVEEFDSFIPCNFEACEARCCYDGVYLMDDEDVKIQALVESDPSYFSHLPEEYIVDGSWGSEFSGVKTATKPHHYKSYDYPDHFEKTRCVFAFENGACSLQAYAIARNEPPWAYKPVSCVMHPVQAKPEGVNRPTLLGERDPQYVSLKYPGYSSFTPCGQPSLIGKSWEVNFRQEIDYWEEFIIARSKS